MKPHTKLYLNAFDYPFIQDSYIPCEIGKNEFNNCLNKATDIHHIIARGMGGSKNKDRIENLMALCRNCHIDYGDIKHLIPTLFDIHKKRMDLKNVKYDNEFFHN